MKRNEIVICLLAVISFYSCSIQKDILELAQEKSLKFQSFPEDYCSLFPSSDIHQWDQDYNKFRKFLTPKIMKTQLGLSSTAENGYKTWYCFPSASPHVQLDTATFIYDNQKLQGNWRIIANRQIQFIDSAVYADQKIYRTTTTLNDNTQDDVIASIDEQKFKLYFKPADKPNYKTAINKNYSIESKRYLLIHGLSKTTAGVSLIGMDSSGNLIINNYGVHERQIRGIYIVYETIMNQMIFKKME